eukprot:CAMPEP_0170504688 /NCGR_PEP_ID=MMETSP0208-20121228/48687_1 /TAXON_ID=197538 /ORGANISM="Strombidium inclinatum, Strain S3" /LENGTH=68 /DNA_ID=CAMNT_0010785087 /DNA_START=510 /DNA_END=713 /DNA_ORIENTATION=+
MLRLGGALLPDAKSPIAQNLATPIAVIVGGLLRDPTLDEDVGECHLLCIGIAGGSLAEPEIRLEGSVF